MLSSCPRLEELDIRYASTIDFTGAPRQPFPSLRVLRIVVREERIDHDRMLLLLKQLPSLAYLEIHPWQQLKALTDIQQHCPSLKCLEYSYNGAHKYWIDLPMDPSQPGLQSIQIHDLKGTADETIGIGDFLERNHTTLRVLDLCIGTQGKELNLMFPLLRHLVIQYRYPEANTVYGSWIPKYAPNIEHLVVDMHAIHKCRGLVGSLKYIKKLRTLQFYVGEQPLHPYHEQLHSFLTQQTDMQSLELCIRPDQFHDGAWFTAIYNMPELRSLDLIMSQPVHHTFPQFMKGILNHCPLLEQFYVGCRGGITHEAIVFLVRLKHLKVITLPLKDMSHMAIISLGSLQALKAIKIIPGPEDQKAALQLLMETRRDIHMTTSLLYS